MEQRRDFLRKALGVLGGGAAVAADAATTTEPGAEAQPVVMDPTARDSFPDVEVTAHTGVRYRFYEDLVKPGVVTINFMSVRGEADFPIMGRMADLAGALGPRLGRDVRMLSLTRDPEFDTPARLAAFARELQVGDGWLLLHAEPAVMLALETRMYRHRGGGPAAAHGGGGARKVDLVFYGHGGVGVWGTFPTDIRPDDAAERLGWVMPGEMPSGPPRRAGPRLLSADERGSHNRDA